MTDSSIKLLVDAWPTNEYLHFLFVKWDIGQSIVIFFPSVVYMTKNIDLLLTYAHEDLITLEEQHGYSSDIQLKPTRFQLI